MIVMMAPSADVCERCSENFIVSNKYIKCFFCENKYHASCVAIKDNWLKIFNENANMLWVCDPCKENQNPTKKSGVINDVLSAENVLLRQLIDEKDSKNLILEDNIVLLKEKIENLVQKLQISEMQQKNHEIAGVNKDNSSDFIGVHRIPMCTYSSVVERDRDTSNVTIKQNQKSQAVSNHNLKMSNNNKQPVFRIEQVRSAIMEANQLNKMKENSTTKDGDNNTEWKYVKRKRNRQFVVGQNNNIGNITTVPKYVSLHVTRLHPQTKATDVLNILKDKFPGVSCEIHESRHPDKYVSMKVNIRQENLKDAWKKEVWPSGALVSKFFVKKRLQQLDP